MRYEEKTTLTRWPPAGTRCAGPGARTPSGTATTGAPRTATRTAACACRRCASSAAASVDLREGGAELIERSFDDD